MNSNISGPFMRVGFNETVASGLSSRVSEEMQLLQTGPGMTVAQSDGNLIISAGTTPNSETVIRSNVHFRGALLARWKTLLSGRLAENNFRVELADIVGEGLSYTINDATSVTVTFPDSKPNPFTSENVGQSVRLSCITGSAGVPGRYAISAVSGQNVTFAVSGWPASGTGMLMLYGFNWIACDYTGTSATIANLDTQRRGRNNGASAVTTHSTAAPGHVGQFSYDVNTLGFADATPASSNNVPFNSRGSRLENLPDEDVELHVFLVAQNGAAAPATSTQWSVSFVQVEDTGRQKVRIASTDASAAHSALVSIVSGTLMANIGACGAVYYLESTAALAANASVTGATRDNTASPLYQRFAARSFADQNGTLVIESSTDGTTWREVRRVLAGADQGTTLDVLVMERYYRSKFVNGAVANTAFRMTSGFFRI